MITDAVTVQTPASTSNCGPGFDVLGIALSLYNYVRVQATETNAVSYSGDGDMPKASIKMVEQAARLFFKTVGIEAHGLSFDIWGQIPIARGLGSSSTLRAGIVAGLNAIHGNPLDKDGLANAVCQLDHSPDNTCPLVHGGFCVARTDSRSGRYLFTLKHAVATDVRFVVISPENRVLTDDARAVLPEKLPFKDAVRSINSVATVVSIFASQKYSLLENAITDFIHHPYRGKLNPFFVEAVRAGRNAGAWNGWLSGSGSSVLCICSESVAKEVAREMAAIFEQAQVQSQRFILEADNDGLKLVS
ncbi:MAG: homoserine kinase [Verrucomicrobiota bacterium]